MIPVIIVEDEILDLNHLKRSVNYEKLGLEIVGEADNGKDALRLVELHKPQIIIMDIVIPEFSGIELVRKLKESGSTAKTVFITGHQNFDYARYAIEYGVSDYLIKPVLPEQLENLLQRLAAECIADNRLAYERNFYKEQFKANFRRLQDLLIRDLIMGKEIDCNNIEDQLSFYHIELTANGILVILIYPDKISTSQKGIEYKDKNLNDLAIQNIIDDFILQSSHVSCATFDSEKFIVLCQFSEKNSPMSFLLADNMRNEIYTKTGASCTVGVGIPVDGYNHIPVSYKCAEIALEHRFFIGCGQTIIYSDTGKNYLNNRLCINKYRDLLSMAIKKGDQEEVKHLLDQMLQLVISEGMTQDYIKAMGLELLSSILTDHESFNTDHENQFILDPSVYTTLLEAETLSRLFSIMETKLVELCKTQADWVFDRSNLLVGRMKDLIKAKYMEDLTVDKVSGHVFLSAGYAATLFKKVTGETIVEYITKTRLDEAAKLLKNPDARIGETAQRVGYANVAYFSSLFKKHLDMTPREYRDNFLSPK